MSKNVKIKGIEDAKKASQIPFQLKNFRNLPVRNIMRRIGIVPNWCAVTEKAMEISEGVLSSFRKFPRQMGLGNL